MKVCTRCREPKDPTEFYSDQRNSDGLRSHCKRCVRDENRGPRRGPSAEPYRRGQHHQIGDELSVECWCRRSVVWVPSVEVMAVRTRSCGRPSCEAPS